MYDEYATGVVSRQSIENGIFMMWWKISRSMSTRRHGAGVSGLH